MTIQWRFDDADPWHVRIDNGSTAAEPGVAPDPDLTIESSWQDWIGIVEQGRRRPPARAAPPDPPARLAAQPAAAAEGLPAAAGEPAELAAPGAYSIENSCSWPSS